MPRSAALPPPRLYVIPAADAPIAAVFARTAGWSLLARWDLDDGSVAPGAWLRGTVYPRRSDLSSDGRFVYYFALKGGRSFHAVSRLPWLTALAFWRDSGTWSRGGHFESMLATNPDGFLARAPDVGDVGPLSARHRLALRANPVGPYRAEFQRGWTEHPSCPPRSTGGPWDENREHVLQRPAPVHGARLVLVDHGYTHAMGSVCGRKPTYRIEHGRETMELPGVVWADWDRRGRLLVATEAGALEIRDVARGTLTSRSLAGIRPAPAPPPKPAGEW